MQFFDILTKLDGSWVSIGKVCGQGIYSIFTLKYYADETQIGCSSHQSFQKSPVQPMCQILIITRQVGLI